MAQTTTINLDELLKQINTPDPISFQYFRHLLQKRTIIINDDISQDTIELVIMPLLEMENDGSGDKITIYLNTLGGQVYNGLVLCDIISKLKTSTEIIVLGYAYSMGSLILMSAFNNPNVITKCYPFSTALIHGGSDYIQGSNSQIKDYFNFNTKYENKIKEFILKNSNISEKEYKKMEKSEWYLMAEEMLKYGLVKEIIS